MLHDIIKTLKVFFSQKKKREKECMNGRKKREKREGGREAEREGRREGGGKGKERKGKEIITTCGSHRGCVGAACAS